MALRHELQHQQDNQNGIFIPKDKSQNEFAINHSLNLLDMSAKALDINGYNINNYKFNTNLNDPSIKQNTDYLYSLDKSKSDDCIMQAVGETIGAGSNLYAQYERNGGSLYPWDINWVELGLNTAMGAWSGGATSLGSSVVRGGVASMVTETYNQAEYNKDGMNGVEIFKKGVIGGGIGFGISGAGKIGNNINNKKWSSRKAN